MIDSFLQACLDDPIRSAERANKLYLPAGKTVVVEDETVKAARLAKSRMKAAQTKKLRNDKRAQLLDYYAGTSVSPEDVAKHTGLKMEDVLNGLRERGRAI
ncbi:hypothetical protein [Sphingobium sp. HDIP04]|uniref:hypothetical protein n=1 Tax=Sphingobium sp. HDIP04 TaxID=428994 RepID=UPI0003878634|nr:hypothetical protein [Sphingobium sp. HDIP04]EQB03898.1 hypothetical protein L286_11070 [Sphingobium sp. HDIP04]